MSDITITAKAVDIELAIEALRHRAARLRNLSNEVELYADPTRLHNDAADTLATADRLQSVFMFSLRKQWGA